MHRTFQTLQVKNRIGLMAKMILPAALLASCLLAQPQIQVVLDPANANPLTAPVPVILDIQLANNVAPGPSAIEFSIILPAGASATSAVTGVAATLGKQIQCALIGQNYNCLVYGLADALPIGGLTFARVSVTFGATGVFPVGPSSPFLSDPTGSLIVVTAGPSLSITIPAPPPTFSPCDLNKDGKVDPLDIANSALQVIHVLQCTNGDLDGDGLCTSGDHQRIVNASLPGGVCKVGK